MTSPGTPNYDFARLAVDKAKLCPVNPSAKHAPPRVAVVIAEGTDLLGWYAKEFGGEINAHGDLQKIGPVRKAHAEEALLKALEGRDLSNATAYVTLEPCTNRKDNVSCCADLLVQSGIKHVYVANVDPNPIVGALAWQKFFANGINVSDFPPELRNEARRDNDPFFRKFHTSVSSEDGAAFDYEANGGSAYSEQPPERSRPGGQEGELARFGHWTTNLKWPSPKIARVLTKLTIPHAGSRTITTRSP
jgi:pyrimidine deaminase RibD-like protein